ncbi:unnamed protein product [Heligmosomoides polygyrus]|uniref:Uncharacterized protein n=1 Tax=Heligmosomoides polygyrus TaxID=6339 RepID=A0A183GML7_HELPZ|nr:unnamed protein product [Heligmosomoides polygyrus]
MPNFEVADPEANVRASDQFNWNSGYADGTRNRALLKRKIPSNEDFSLQVAKSILNRIPAVSTECSDEVEKPPRSDERYWSGTGCCSSGPMEVE